MSEEITEVLEIHGTPIKDNESKAKKKSKFLPFGKYFLLFVVFIAQIFLAYTIVDKNYGQVYQIFHGNKSDVFATYRMEELVVNPAGTNGKRYLLVEISLELDDEEHIKVLESKSMKVKQDMIETLSGRTIEQLTNHEGREILRRDLIWLINQSIGTRSVRNLYFTKYVMQ